MAGNSFGQLFRLTTFGESHGAAIGGVIDGCPSGIELDIDAIQTDLNRRKPGQSALVTQRKEPDEVVFYSAIFDDSYNEIRQTLAEIITLNSYDELLKLSPVYFIGSGVTKSQELISHPNTRFIKNKLPSASQMCNLTYSKFIANDFEDVAYFEPYYLKDFIAIPPKKQF